MAAARAEMDEILVRQRKEVRDLTARITQKKKSASKKTRKGVNDECAALEQELKTKHETELRIAAGVALEDNTEGGELEDGQIEEKAEASAAIAKIADNNPQLATQVQQMNLDDTDTNETTSSQPRKRNRQKERLARRAAEQEVVAAQAATEAASLPDLRKKERDRLVAEFASRNLEEKPVAANGHCMFSAVADQLHSLGLNLEPGQSPDHVKTELQRDDYKTVRSAAASYMSKHPHDFEPFLDEPLDAYVQKIRDTAEWGGQLELTALAKTYNITINVLQGDGRVEKIQGDHVNHGKHQAWLAYYRHGFGLGEHYNSLKPLDPKPTQEATP